MGRRVITAADVKRRAVAVAVPVGGAGGAGFGAPVPGAAGTAAPEKVDTYVSKLMKYMPAEVVAAYVAIEAIFKSVADVSTVIQWIVVGVLLVFTPLYIWRLTEETGQPTAWAQIIVATIAFPVWIFSLGGPFATYDWYQPYYGAILLTLYTLAIPLVIGKEPTEAPAT